MQSQRDREKMATFGIERVSDSLDPAKYLGLYNPVFNIIYEILSEWRGTHDLNYSRDYEEIQILDDSGGCWIDARSSELGGG